MENCIITVFVVHAISCLAMCQEFPMQMIQCSYPGNLYYPDDPTTGLYRPEFAKYTHREKDCCVAANRYKCCVTTTNNYGRECKCEAGLVCQPLVPTSYCNVVGARILNSQTPYYSCGDFPGVFRVAIVTPTDELITLCNAILTSTPTTWKLISTQRCVTTVEKALALNKNLVVQTSQNGENIPLSNFKVENGVKGIGYFNFDYTKDPQAAIKLYAVCRRLACTQTAAMAGKIDTNECHVLSYGSVETGTLSQDGMKQLAVKTATDCLNKDKNPDYACYTTKDGGKSLCAGDDGAPVFCKTKDTKENVVVGIVVENLSYCGESASFWVAPYQF